jgi:hypothetical protein
VESPATEGGLGRLESEAREAEPSALAPTNAVLFPGSFPERWYDCLEKVKKEYSLPFDLGTWNWFHVNQDGPNRSGYGIPPTQAGTYFYYFHLDPTLKVDWGPITKIGYHGELRWRDDDYFRSFYRTQVWMWEDYFFADTTFGKFKVGQIWKRFGTDWDTGTFWGNVQYFDGFKLNPDYGVSWENTWKVATNFKVDSWAQFFWTQDGINGSVAGADSESLPGSTRQNTGVVRLVPTFTFQDHSTLALGLSGEVGQVINKPIVGYPSQTIDAFALDATYTKGKFQALGEVDQAWGVFNPDRYVSDGPSHRITDALIGCSYRYQAAKFYVNYSAGFDENPSGWQSLLVPGVVFSLTKNIDFYAEYVNWRVFPASGTKNTIFEDGYQLVFNVRF